MSAVPALVLATIIALSLLPSTAWPQAADAVSNNGLTTPFPDGHTGNWPHPPETANKDPRIPAPAAENPTPAGTISVVSLKAPERAREAYRKGVEAARAKNFAEAEKHLEKAVRTYGRFADAWCVLGEVREERRETAEARAAYSQALTADPNLMLPYLRLAAMAGREEKWQETLQLSDHAIGLNPVDFPAAYYYNALAYFRMGKLEAAETRARKALVLDTHHALLRINLLLADILVARENFLAAEEQLRTYLELAPGAANAKNVRAYLAGVERLAAKARTAAN